MGTELDPIIGNWYRHLDKGQTFRVVTIDDHRGLLELQHFDGDIEEVEASAWHEMDLELAEAPEDWTGPMDDVERDDLGYSETEMTDRDWREPLAQSPRSQEEAWQDAHPADQPTDEWAEGAAGEELAEQERIENEPIDSST